jgi:exodeoxyribonuclease VII small subunit
VPKKPAPINFEESLAQLEALVAHMESGELPLEEALSSFERGIQLTRECQSALQAAQHKVQILMQRPEGTALEEFATDEGHDDDDSHAE